MAFRHGDNSLLLTHCTLTHGYNNGCAYALYAVRDGVHAKLVDQKRDFIKHCFHEIMAIEPYCSVSDPIKAKVEARFDFLRERANTPSGRMNFLTKDEQAILKNNRYKFRPQDSTPTGEKGMMILTFFPFWKALDADGIAHHKRHFLQAKNTLPKDGDVALTGGESKVAFGAYCQNVSQLGSYMSDLLQAHCYTNTWDDYQPEVVTRNKTIDRQKEIADLNFSSLPMFRTLPVQQQCSSEHLKMLCTPNSTIQARCIDAFLTFLALTELTIQPHFVIFSVTCFSNVADFGDYAHGDGTLEEHTARMLGRRLDLLGILEFKTALALLKKGTMVLLPCHVKGKHFILLTLTHNDDIIDLKIYDSAHYNGRYNVTTLVKQLIEYYFHDQTINVHRVNCEHQGKTNDCGPHTCRNVLRKIQRKAHFFHKQKKIPVNEFRDFMVHGISYLYTANAIEDVLAYHRTKSAKTLGDGGRSHGTDQYL
eukprot:Nk52_evm1s2479 gene=Nk52_evmTU1s2479